MSIIQIMLSGSNFGKNIKANDVHVNYERERARANDLTTQRKYWSISFPFFNHIYSYSAKSVNSFVYVT